MAEAKSKRDLIWEEKRRQREERLLRMEGQIQENNVNSFQLPPPRFDEQLPISYPTKQEYEPYIPPEPYIPNQQEPILYNEQPQQNNFRENRNNQQQPPPMVQASPLRNPIKQQQDEYREILKKQMEEKEQEKKRTRDNGNGNQMQFSQPTQYQQAQPPPLPPQPINRQKQEYGDFLRQQMQEKEESKKRRISSGNNNFQQAQYQPEPQYEQQQQYQQVQYQQQAPQQQQINPGKIQKQEYGDYLRMQMQLKEQEKNDKKKNLQQKMETGDSFPFGKGGGGAPVQKQPVVPQSQAIYPPQYNQAPPQQFYQQPQQPQQYQVQYQQPVQYSQPQPQQMSQPQNFAPVYQQNSYQEQMPLEFDQQPLITDPQGPAQLKAGRNRLMMENVNIEDVRKKEQQKLEMQRVLQEQIEQKKRKKEQERLQKEQEDRIEEERFRKQQEQEENQKKREEDQKKQQQGKFEQDNIDIKEKKRLERIQERKNRKIQQDDQPPQNNEIFEQPLFIDPPSRNAPPSQPKSENYLKDFLLNEKMKEGVSPQQSIVDFYRNGPIKQSRQEVQQNREIEELKKQMMQQQDNLQQQIQQVMSQAQMAIEGRNKAEQELINLKEQVKNKYLQEERHHDDLMVALVKNDPKWEKQVFPPHLLAQAEIAEYRDLSMPALKENLNLPNSYKAAQTFQPAYQSKPIVMKEETKEQKQQYREQFGLQSLVSDSNMVPIDANASLVPQPFNKRIPEPQLDKIDELNAHFEDTLKMGGTEHINYKDDPFSRRPPSNNGQHPSWNVPSIDSEFVREIDDLLKYKPAQQTINKPPEQKQLYQSFTNRPPSSNQRPPSSTNQRPPSTFGRAAKGILGTNEINYKGITLDSEFPDLTMAKKNVDTLDIAGVHKRMDQKLMHLNEFEEDEDLQKLDKLLYQYNS